MTIKIKESLITMYESTKKYSTYTTKDKKYVCQEDNLKVSTLNQLNSVTYKLPIVHQVHLMLSIHIKLVSHFSTTLPLLIISAKYFAIMVIL